MAALAVIAFAGLRAQTAPIVLEDFSSVRMNHDSPPSPLWQPYLGPPGSDWNGQTGAIVDRTFELTVPASKRPYFQFLPYPYSSISGFAKGNLRSGEWNADVNRLSFWMKTNATITHRPGGAQTAEVGTYAKVNDGEPSNQGDHYYHYLYANWTPGQWMLVTLNRQVQHKVGQDPNINWTEDPTFATIGVHYFDALTRFYVTDEYGDPAVWGNHTYTFADVEFAQVGGEPDNLVASVTATYTGEHYELSWAGPKNSPQAYAVHYATTSLHRAGLASATRSGSIVSTPGNAYQGVLWTSPPMAQPPGGMYFAIQPIGQYAFTEIYLPSVPPFARGGAEPPPPPAGRALN